MEVDFDSLRLANGPELNVEHMTVQSKVNSRSFVTSRGRRRHDHRPEPRCIFAAPAKTKKTCTLRSNAYCSWALGTTSNEIAALTIQVATPAFVVDNHHVWIGFTGDECRCTVDQVQLVIVSSYGAHRKAESRDLQ
uniref:Uncharacterized protein n=1 Tax=Hyaloperonospora arabidopsidis (strain Emoy2) TaxID=559515 RepID=M4B5H5_HYAAE